jgi:isoquinoline 1-oxidoreductase beta subunit
MAAARKNSSEVSRRGVLTGGLAGGFLLAFHVPVRAANEPVQPPDVTEGKFAPNAFIRIDTAGKTTLVMPQVEMGQGVYTAVAMILAEELDADYSQVTLQHAPPNDKLYGNPTFGLRKRARHAGAGRRAAMAGRARELHRVKRAGGACG